VPGWPWLVLAKRSSGEQIVIAHVRSLNCACAARAVLAAGQLSWGGSELCQAGPAGGISGHLAATTSIWDSGHHQLDWGLVAGWSFCPLPLSVEAWTSDPRHQMGMGQVRVRQRASRYGPSARLRDARPRAEGARSNEGRGQIETLGWQTRFIHAWRERNTIIMRVIPPTTPCRVARNLVSESTIGPSRKTNYHPTANPFVFVFPFSGEERREIHSFPAFERKSACGNHLSHLTGMSLFCVQVTDSGLSDSGFQPQEHWLARDIAVIQVSSAGRNG